MNTKDLITKLKSEVESYIKEEKSLKNIDKALKYAVEGFASIKHYDNSLFLDHAIRTCTILAELHSSDTTIIAGLLNWLPTYNESITTDNIIEEFGEEVGSLVENLQKIDKLKLANEDENSAINLRKILVGLSSDVRVIIIKLADRLDNLRCVYTTPSEVQKQKCIETENVYIPIAHRLGINYIKSELEDLCLRYLKPDVYNEILDNLNASRDELNGYIEEMKENLSEMMIEHNIKFRIKGRVKSVHSLYDKLSKGKMWKDIYDILALRIIVEKESECYLAIGLIHAKYRPIPKRFKDYIAQPKENMYQSLHTGVIGPNGNIFEIQIRTEEMDEIAECGIASHWSYKEHGTKAIQSLMEQKLELFRDAIETSNDDDVVNEFKETFVEKMIYVFTPKGDVIELPEGSTPVDFAYRIHSHVGDTLVGAIVNDQIVPIDYELKTDDIVKIRTNESSTPKKEWLSIVKTNQAKNKIKAYFSKQDREEYVARGEELLNKEIRRRKWSISDTLTDDNKNKLIKLLKLKDFDELLLSIGSLRYTASYVVSLLVEEKHELTDTILERLSSNNVSTHEQNYKNDIIVAGCDDILVTIASCCTPVQGDEIVGFITKGNGITVHKKSCVNIKDETTRLIDVSWNTNSESSYLARLLIKTNNINNNLLDIVTKSSQRNLSIESVNTYEHGNTIDYELLVKVPNTDILKQFMIDLETLSFIISVERVNR